MNIRNQLSFILAGSAPNTSKQLVFSRELAKKKQKTPSPQPRQINQLLFSRSKIKELQTSCHLPHPIKTQRGNIHSKGSLQSFSQLQDICNQSKMLNISSQIVENLHELPLSSILHIPKHIDFPKRKKKSLLCRLSPHPLMSRSSSRHSELQAKQRSSRAQPLLSDLKILNSFKKSRQKDRQPSRKTKRHQPTNI